MFTVALIGPDGAGKTTIGRRLEQTLPVPVKNLYMGVNLDSSDHMLPTTRLFHATRRLLGAKPDAAGPPDPDRMEPRRSGIVRRVIFGFKSNLYLFIQVSEEWWRQGLSWYYRHQGGHIVLFDRHFFCDYYTYDIAPGEKKRPLRRRVHGLMLERVYPKPDLVIYMDAPAEVLFARKGEGTLKVLERRRQDYLRMRAVVKNFAVVDASKPEDEVVSDVTKLIMEFYRKRSSSR
ncbi:MAG TPA: hypothetical protein VNH22_05300 [Blastocatellia bacterium]|jgi:thymidylate kinase|nr:hypothetical protein [Blastocatellia bacterium]